MKNRSKSYSGCPYCCSPKHAEDDWSEEAEGRKTKRVLYECGTELRLNKIGARYQNNRFTNKCSILAEVEGAPV